MALSSPDSGEAMSTTCVTLTVQPLHSVNARRQQVYQPQEGLAGSACDLALPISSRSGA